MLIIKCVSLPNLSISSSTYICNSSTFVLAILFLIVNNRFQEGLKSFFIIDATQFYPISRDNGGI